MARCFAPPEALSGEAAYQGRLTASMTHEFKNVLAIIGETTGLMEDLLEAASPNASSDTPLSSRLTELLAKVGKQVNRGQRLATNLNRFAHLPDARSEMVPGTVDPARLTALALALSERLAMLRKIRLEAGQMLEGSLDCDPVLLHRALCAALEHEWKLLPAGSTLSVSCGPTPDGYAWRLGGLSGEDQAPPGPLSGLDETAAATAVILAWAGLTYKRETGALLLHWVGAPRGDE